MKKIETKRLILFQPTVQETPILKNLWIDPKVREFLGGVALAEIIQEKIDSIHKHWHEHGFGMWVVSEKKLQKIIGICGLQNSLYGIELSYMMFPSFWGKGLASEAALTSVQHGFKIHNFEKITAITQENNIRSCRLLENIGMINSGTSHLFNAKQTIYILSQR